MNLEQAIIERRAIYPKQFSGGRVKREHIDKALEMANWAPTHRRTEPWRFFVYEQEAKDELLNTLADIIVSTTPADEFQPSKLEKYNQRKMQVSHIVVIGMSRNAEGIIPEWEEEASVAMAVQNMWLYLSHTREAAGYWSTPKACFTERFSNYVGLQKEVKCMGVFYIGAIEKQFDWPKGQRSNWADKVTWNS